MQIYLAPLEGVTGYLYRNAFRHHFGGVDRAYAPFAAPNKNESFSPRERRDLDPAHNRELETVPQLLTNNAAHFRRAAEELAAWGYGEVNLNLGCPSATVTRKGKGAGFLAEPAALEHFLEEIFTAPPLDISIKTRIGAEDVAEWPELLDIFNRFPLKMLIVHPRLLREQYGGRPHWDAFELAVKTARAPLCYNGDIRTVEDYRAVRAAFPSVEAVMLGRGLVGNPTLAEEIRGGAPADIGRRKDFHDELLAAYRAAFSGDRPVLFKMRELWEYWLPHFASGARHAKALRKADTVARYLDVAERLFAEG